MLLMWGDGDEDSSEDTDKEHRYGESLEHFLPPRTTIVSHRPSTDDCFSLISKLIAFDGY